MEGKPFRVCPHLRQRRSSIPDACVAPHGVHQRVGGERVVGGPRAHVLLKALNDYPIGPEDHKCPQTQMKTCKHEDAACRSAENHLLIMFYCLLLLKPRVSSCLWPVQNFYFSWSLSTQVLLVSKESVSTWKHSDVCRSPPLSLNPSVSHRSPPQHSGCSLICCCDPSSRPTSAS